MIFKSKFSMTKKQAFTLIELLIVIAIIGILFIVLVSRVDFATDKAKAAGVQTDFRSFQVALDQVAKENAGFNIFGWDTGDVNGDHIRNSYDHGDTNQNGIEDAGETFIGRKEYGEDWTTIYTLLNPKVGMENDTGAFEDLEQAINANLDPKLHITITPDVDGGNLTGNATITMANQARDPWKNEYHGVFITNAARDNGADRGAIIIYSNGANGKWGSAHDITNGVVVITVSDNNKLGQDDMSIVSCYTYVNGYGEVKNMTTGFSSNQSFLAGNGMSDMGVIIPDGETPEQPEDSESVYAMLNGQQQVFEYETNVDLSFRSEADYNKFKELHIDGNVVSSEYYTVRSGSTIVTIFASYLNTLPVGEHIIEIVSDDGSASTNFNTVLAAGLYRAGTNELLYDYHYLIDNGYLYNMNGTLHTYDSLYGGTKSSDFLVGDLLLPTSADIIAIGDRAFYACHDLNGVRLPETIVSFGSESFRESNISFINLPDALTSIGRFALWDTCLTEVTIPANVTYLGEGAVYHVEAINVASNNAYYTSVDGILYSKDMTELIKYPYTKSSDSYIMPDSVTTIQTLAFSCESGPRSITLNDKVVVDGYTFDECYGLENIYVKNSNTKYVSINGVLYSIDMTKLIKYPYAKTDENFIIPDTVTTIGTYAFFQGTVPFNLTIPASVAVFEANALNEASIIELTINNKYCVDVFYGLGGSWVQTIVYNGTTTEFYALNLDERWIDMLEFMWIESIICTNDTIYLERME